MPERRLDTPRLGMSTGGILNEAAGSGCEDTIPAQK